MTGESIAETYRGAVPHSMEGNVMTKSTLESAREAAGPFKRERITQSNGFTYQGEMRLIAALSTEKDGKHGWQELEIWETPKGNWITLFIGVGQREFRKAEYLTDVQPDDPAFQMRVWEALDGVTAARTMLREQFGWRFIIEVD